jgi:hypothetical protein
LRQIFESLGEEFLSLFSVSLLCFLFVVLVFAFLYQKSSKKRRICEYSKENIAKRSHTNGIDVPKVGVDGTGHMACPRFTNSDSA